MAPNRDASRFVRAAGLAWHVQVAGQGPVLLLLHGTGAATHSWRDLLPLLARSFTVVAPDLPGHGFTEAPAARRLSLPGMARDLRALLWALQVEPVLAVGHSAGARHRHTDVPRWLHPSPRAGRAERRAAAARRGGGADVLATGPRADGVAAVAGAVRLAGARAPGTVAKLLRDTGSRLDARGEALYARVVREPAARRGAALGMMAHWDLNPLVRDLPSLAPRLLLVTGAADRTIPAGGLRAGAGDGAGGPRWRRRCPASATWRTRRIRRRLPGWSWRWQTETGVSP